MKKSLLITICLLFGFCNTQCAADQLSDSEQMDQPSDSESEISTQEPVTGIRIAWDASTKTQISELGDVGYNGYARVIQLTDGALVVTYESHGKILVKRSTDLGQTWSSLIVVADYKNGVSNTTPDLIELKNGTILLAYNPRPGNTASVDEHFSIKVIQSSDGGRSWHNDQTVYTADTLFENGAWEPTFLQLPSGEIQLYFSNENIYRNSNEQNISILRSTDNGLSWTLTPEITSFRSGHRDGMPAPIYLKDTEEIVYAIEDNGDNNQFKPYIIRNTLAQNWSTFVSSSSPNRSYALQDALEKDEYAGAPDLVQLANGEVLLSYQGTENRAGTDLNNAEMRVAIGNKIAQNFNRTTSPFVIPENKSALWNSITVLEDGTVLALTTTNAFSSANNSEVWMIKGYVIPQLRAERATINIDGAQTEDIWEHNFPLFVGHMGDTQLRGTVSADSNNLYILTRTTNNQGASTIATQNNANGTILYLDPQAQNKLRPDAGIFKIQISVKGEVAIYEGAAGNWDQIEAPQLQVAVAENEGVIQEIAIPWEVLHHRFQVDTELGFSIALIERGEANYTEMLSTTNGDEPYTWLRLKI